MPNKLHIHIAFFLIGLISIVTQIVFVKQMISIWGGNELAIAIIFSTWMFWTAVGNLTAIKLIKSKLNVYSLFILLISICCFILPFNYVLIFNFKRKLIGF